MIQTALTKTMGCLGLVAAASLSVGCNVVVASGSYTEDNLPKNDSDGSYIFHGYVQRSGAPVRMQARSRPEESWRTIKTVNATGERTYADAPGGSVYGYYWHVSYTLDELAAFENASTHLAFVRFVTKNSNNTDVVLSNSSGDLDDCYFDARALGDSPYEAATGCPWTTGIRVAFNPPPPPPPPDCPPQTPDCHENVVAPGDGTAWTEGMGTAAEGP